MKTSKFLTLLLFLLFALFVSTEALRCRECKQTNDFGFCNQLQNCSDDERCYIEVSINDNLQLEYIAGCRSEGFCNSSNSLIGRRKRNNLVTCAKCCNNTDDCNYGLCGNNGGRSIPIKCVSCKNATDISQCTRMVSCNSESEECYVDRVFTSQNNFMFNAGCRDNHNCNYDYVRGKRELPCSSCCHDKDDCNEELCSLSQSSSTNLSPLHCQRCDMASDISKCQTITCNKNAESCYMEEFITPTLEVRYNGGCLSKQVCNIKRKRDAVTCIRCCDNSDNCNKKICGIPQVQSVTQIPSAFLPANILQCRKCRNAVDILDCEGYVSCDAIMEKCFMEAVIDELDTMRYNGGCMAKTLCGSKKKRSTMLSKRQGPDLVACSRCCEAYDNCNNHLCGLPDRSTTPTIPTTTMAPRNLTCLHCIGATYIDDCIGNITCDGLTEDCYMDELVTDQLTVEYNGGCRSKDVCGMGTGKKRSDMFACSRCCDYDDGCNIRLCGIKRDPLTKLNVTVGDKMTLDCDPSGTSSVIVITKTDNCGKTTNITFGSNYVVNAASYGDAGTYKCLTSSSQTIQLFKVDIIGSRQAIICDVESTCTWTQDTSDTMDWSEIRGPTQSGSTGPDNDHTLGNGNGAYFYIEASSPRRFGDYAYINSPVLPANTSKCIEFWYSMYGDGIGSLVVETKDVCLGTENKIFSMSGDQGPAWHKSFTTIQTSNVPNDYMIRIKGTVGMSFHGDIGIDDIRIQHGPCGGQGTGIIG
ncbi:MAM and LDL-receptor class A domain-containing protein [Mactra antiquata]